MFDSTEWEKILRDHKKWVRRLRNDPHAVQVGWLRMFGVVGILYKGERKVYPLHDAHHILVMLRGEIEKELGHPIIGKGSRGGKR